MEHVTPRVKSLQRMRQCQLRLTAADADGSEGAVQRREPGVL
jgi:hypothetical protein